MKLPATDPTTRSRAAAAAEAGEAADLYTNTAEFYDYIAPYASRQDVKFFVEEAVRSGGPVLEMGCGTGRVLLPTAAAGIEVTGLDQSTSMLDICRRKLAAQAAELARRVDLVQGDMRNFDLGERFALITCPFRPFQHLTEVEDQLACLASARSHLLDDGRLILDLFDPSLPRLTDPTGVLFGAEPEVTLPDGRRVVRSHRIAKRDYPRQVNTIDLVHDVTLPDGTVTQEVYTFEMRYFFRYELEHLLWRAGFEIENLYSDYDRTPYGEKYPRELIAVARKR